MPETALDDSHTVYFVGELGLNAIPVIISNYLYEKAKAEGLFKE